MAVFSEAGGEQIVINSLTEWFARSSKKKKSLQLFPLFFLLMVCVRDYVP